MNLLTVAYDVSSMTDDVLSITHDVPSMVDEPFNLDLRSSEHDR